MKRYKKAITAAYEIDEIHNGAFADIAMRLSEYDYEMTVDDDFNVTVKCVRDKEFMPEIKITTVEEEGVYYLLPDLKFPELKADDMDYADSVLYWVEDKWVKVAKIIKDINKFSYDPTAYEE